MSEINTFNRHMVSVNFATAKVLVMAPPRHDSLGAEEAMLLAAWLAVCARILNPTLNFEEYITAVEST